MSLDPASSSKASMRRNSASLPRGGDSVPPVGDFSYVEVSGCLARGADATWRLEHASDPVAVRPVLSSGPQPSATAAPPRGRQAFQLIDAMAYEPERHVGHLWKVRGTLIRLPGQQRLAISSVEMVASTCE